MKKLVLSLMFMCSQFAFAQGEWKNIANETIWPNAPSYRQYQIMDKDSYNEILIQVGTGSVRVMRAQILTDDLKTLPLWSLQGDYRSPRMGQAQFPLTKLRSVLLDMSSLESNRPSQVQVFIR